LADDGTHGHQVGRAATAGQEATAALQLCHCQLFQTDLFSSFFLKEEKNKYGRTDIIQ
jgi:hypothetical protein